MYGTLVERASTLCGRAQCWIEALKGDAKRPEAAYCRTQNSVAVAPQPMTERLPEAIGSERRDVVLHRSVTPTGVAKYE